MYAHNYIHTCRHTCFYVSYMSQGQVPRSCEGDPRAFRDLRSSLGRNPGQALSNSTGALGFTGDRDNLFEELYKEIIVQSPRKVSSSGACRGYRVMKWIQYYIYI